MTTKWEDAIYDLQETADRIRRRNIKPVSLTDHDHKDEDCNCQDELDPEVANVARPKTIEQLLDVMDEDDDSENHEDRLQYEYERSREEDRV